MEKLKTLFDNLGVYYEIVAPKEIRVICPFLKSLTYNGRWVTMDDTSEPEDDYVCLSDEGSILIRQNPDGSLDWLGMV